MPAFFSKDMKNSTTTNRSQIFNTSFMNEQSFSLIQNKLSFRIKVKEI